MSERKSPYCPVLRQKIIVHEINHSSPRTSSRSNSLSKHWNYAEGIIFLPGSPLFMVMKIHHLFADSHPARWIASFRTALVFAVVSVGMMANVMAQKSSGSGGVFNKIWSVSLSQYQGPVETGDALTQLSNGTIVVAGGDQNQLNYCPPNRGGAWLVAVNPSDGSNSFQKLYSTCASAAQLSNSVAHTSDGGFIFAGVDLDNPLCPEGCAWFSKFDGTGAVSWQYDLIGDPESTPVQIQPTSDGGYVAVGNDATASYALQGLILKMSSAGALQWSTTFTETAASFPGAYAGGSFNLESCQQTSDGGYIVSAIADADFNSVYANVLAVLKLDANANVQWSDVYYGKKWLANYPGDNHYSIFQTPDGQYTLSGTVQTRNSPYEELFFLLKLDGRGRTLWQTGYGGSSHGYNVSRDTGGAVLTADGGYVLAGESNVFAEATNGWMLKTDGAGKILWQKTYTGLTSQNGNVFGQVIQTADGGYAVAGSSWTSDLDYGGPGLWLVKTDLNGNIGDCACVTDTQVVAQALDLRAYRATFTRATAGLSFGSVDTHDVTTSVTPTTIFP